MTKNENFADWRKIKSRNSEINRNFATANENAARMGNNHPIPIGKDGKLNFFWTDAHEENHGADIYLFGKVFVPQSKSYQSCCIIVKGM